MKKIKETQKGFSLIELIIAIAILVILTGLLAPQFMKYIERSREAKDLQTLDTIYTGVQGALTSEKACKAVEDDIGTFKNGTEINTVLQNADANEFAKELRNILGASSFKLTSQKAIAGGDIFVSISEHMEVGVFYGERKAGVGTNPYYVNGLHVGVMPTFADPGD